MNRQVTIITIQRNNVGWIALFRGDPQIPNNMWLPLPFNVSATAEMVRNHLRTRFPNAAIVTKAGDRDHD